MGELREEMVSGRSVSELANVFRACANEQYGTGSKLAAMIGGVGGLEFFTPQADPVFGAVDDSRPDFTVGCFIPTMTIAHGAKSAVAIHMYVYELGDMRGVELVAPYSLGEKGASQRVMTRFAEAIGGSPVPEELFIDEPVYAQAAAPSSAAILSDSRSWSGPALDQGTAIFTERLRFEPDEIEFRAQRDAPPESMALLTSHQTGPYSEVGRAFPGLPSPLEQNLKAVVVDRRRRLAVGVTQHPPTQPTIYRAETDSYEPLILDGRFRVFQNFGDVCGMSVSPDGSRLAVLEWATGPSLSVFDLETGSREHLTSYENAAGNETPLWSPDGRWIMVHSRPQPVIVSTESGAWGRLPFTAWGADWWPARGPSVVMALLGEPGAQRIAAIDLSTGVATDVGEVRLPPQPDLDPTRRFVTEPRVSADGTAALVGTTHGPSGAYQERCGSRRRVAQLDLITGRVRPMTAAFLDRDCWIERDHSRWSWMEASGFAGSVSIAQAVRDSLNPPGPDLASQRWSPDSQTETIVTWSI